MTDEEHERIGQQAALIAATQILDPLFDHDNPRSPTAVNEDEAHTALSSAYDAILQAMGYSRRSAYARSGYVHEVAVHILASALYGLYHELDAAEMHPLCVGALPAYLLAMWHRETFRQTVKAK